MDHLFRRHRKRQASATAAAFAAPAVPKAPRLASAATAASTDPPTSLPPSTDLQHGQLSSKRSRITTLSPSTSKSPRSPTSSSHAHSSPRTNRHPPKPPAFLLLSRQEIRNRYDELQWLERSRVQSSRTMPSGPWELLSGTHLRRLDRYTNIQPWARNRVRLQVSANHIDYINASPIVLTTTTSSPTAQPTARYIAMQGPKQASVHHVWRMVYEQLRSPAVMVMLTETHDGLQEKCFPYFPQRPEDPPMIINAHDEFGDRFLASVRCEAIEETPYGDAMELRRVILRVHRRATQNEGTDAAAATAATAAAAASTASSPPDTADVNLDTYEDELTVYHFLYRQWPDFGVPSMHDLDSFFGLMRLSAEKNADADNPRIVHCSAGVGRSGTFIALEQLVHQLKAGMLRPDHTKVPRPRKTATVAGAGQPGSDPFTAASAEAPDTSTDEDAIPDEAQDPIFMTVNQLREQRITMVQSEAQYVFLYQVLRRLWQAKYGADKSVSKDVDDDSDDGDHYIAIEDTSGDEEDGGVATAEADTPDAVEPTAKRVEVQPLATK